MFIAFVNESNRYGTILGAYLRMERAAMDRRVAGDLVFEDDGRISQSTEWLFPWEKDSPDSYARKMQRRGLNVSDFEWTNKAKGKD